MPFIAPIIVAIAGAIGVSVTAAAVNAFLINTVIGLSLSVGLSFLNRQKVQSPPGGVQGQIQFAGDVPRAVAIGLVATEGQIVHWNLFGSKNKSLQLVYRLSEMQCEGLEAVWVDGEKKALVPDAIPVGNTEHARFRVEGYGSRFVVRFFDGRYDQAADKELVTYAQNAGDGTAWAEDDRGRGICYVSLTLTYDDEVFPTGIPSCLWELKGAKLYDARKDSTVPGGSGAQRFDNPSTWTYSENPAVALAHYRRGFFVNDERVCGMGWPAEDISIAHTMAAANICDEEAALAGGGTEHRYRVSVILRDDRQHWDNISALHQAMAGFEVERAGVMAAFAGAAQVPAFTITDADLVAGQPVHVTLKAPRDQLANAIFGTYTEPKDQWQQKAFPPLTNPPYEAEDGGERLPVSIQLPMVRSRTQAKRIAKIRWFESRMQGSGSIPVGYHMLEGEAGDWFIWNSARFGTRSWLIGQDTETKGGFLSWNIKEIDADVYSAAGLDLNPYVPPTRPNVPDLPTTVDVFLLQADIDEQDGVAAPILRASWTPPDDKRVLAVVIEHRLIGSQDASSVRDDTPEDGRRKITGVLPGKDYEARATIVTDPPRLTTWTQWQAVTTSEDNPWAEDVQDILDDLNQDLDDQAAGAKEDAANAARMVLGQRDELIGLFEQVTGALAGSGGRDFLAREAIRTELRVTFGGLSAALVREESVRVSKDEAIAASILSLQASLEGEIDGNASAILAVTARVSATEDDLISQAALLVGLNAELDGLADDVAGNSSAVSGLVATVESHDDRITAASAATTALDSRLTDAEGVATSQATAINGLSTRTASAENFLESLAADQTLLEARIEDAETDIAGNASALQSLTATVNLKIRVYRQAVTPALPDDPLTGGDLWIDTGDNNRLYRWNTTSWVDSTSTNMTVFRQAAAPNTSVTGALWFDTDDNNKLYRWSGSAWVDASDPRVTVHAQLITALEAQLEDAEGNIAGLSSAFDSMEAEVTNIDGRVTAQGTRLSLVEAGVDDATADGLFSIVSIAATGSASTRMALRVRASLAEAFAQAGIYLDAIAGQPSRVLILADRFIIANALSESAVVVPFAVEGAVVRMNIAHIGLITAGRVKSPGSSPLVDINFDTGAAKLLDVEIAGRFSTARFVETPNAGVRNGLWDHIDTFSGTGKIPGRTKTASMTMTRSPDVSHLVKYQGFEGGIETSVSVADDVSIQPGFLGGGLTFRVTGYSSVDYGFWQVDDDGRIVYDQWQQSTQLCGRIAFDMAWDPLNTRGLTRMYGKHVGGQVRLNKLVVPAGRTTCTFRFWGAGGSGSESARGGAGGYASGSFPATPGEVLLVVIGEAGFVFGGPNTLGFGGKAAPVDISYGGGGGLTGIFRNTLTRSNMIACAGGGGGAGGNAAGIPGGHADAGGTTGNDITRMIGNAAGYFSGGEAGAGGGGHEGGARMPQNGNGFWAGRGGTSYLSGAVNGGSMSSAAPGAISPPGTGQAVYTAIDTATGVSYGTSVYRAGEGGSAGSKSDPDRRGQHGMAVIDWS